MEDSEKMYYRDIITPDDSLDRLIDTLARLNETYQGAMTSIAKTGEYLKKTLDSITSSSTASQIALAKTTGTVEQLKSTNDSLRASASSLAATTKTLVDIQNKNVGTTRQQASLNKTAASSYDALENELKEYISLYKSLTEAERADVQMGGEVLRNINAISSKLTSLDAAMRTTNTATADLIKAKQRLANMMSAEEQEAQRLKQQINNYNAAVREQSRIEQELVTSQERLRQARSAANQTLQQYKQEISEANRLAKLNAAIAQSAPGSYNYLAATYEKLKIEVNKLGEAERNTAKGKEMIEHLKATYVQMIRLQEATGNHRLSVGNYSKVWNSFGYSVAQVVRELPSAAMGINTFFLAISNNLPILADEIMRVRQENAALRAQGQPTVSVMKQIKAALLSWNTGLVLVVTALTLFGQKMVDWIKNMKQFRGEAISAVDALANMVNELENSNADFGSTRANLQILTNQWRELKSEGEKIKWIEDNTDAFDDLGIAIRDVDDAENVFVKNTEAVIKAYQARAMAAAALTLAEEEYQKGLQQEQKAMQIKYGTPENVEQAMRIEFRKQQIIDKEMPAAREAGNTEAYNKLVDEINDLNQQLVDLRAEPGFWDVVRSAFSAAAMVGPEFTGSTFGPAQPITSPEGIADARAQLKEMAAQGHEASGDVYSSYSALLRELFNDILAQAGIEVNLDDSSSGGSKQPKDITEQILQRKLQVYKDYNDTLAGLEENEDKRRMIEEKARAENQIAELQDLQRRNIYWLENNGEKGTKEFKELTEEQVKIIEQMNIDINKAIKNIESRVSLDGNKDISRQAHSAATRVLNRYNTEVAANNENPFDVQRGNVRASQDKAMRDLEEQERRLKDYIWDENNLYRDLTEQQLNEAIEAYNKIGETKLLITKNTNEKLRQIDIKENIDRIQRQNEAIKMEHDILEKGANDSLKLALEMNENNRKIALLENSGKPVEQQTSTKTINESFDYQKKQIVTDYSITGYERTLQQAQELNQALYGDTGYMRRQNLKEEKDYWDKIIKLYESGESTITEMEYKTAQANSKNAKRDSGFSGWMGDIADQGLVGGILTNIKFGEKGKGFDPEAIGAFNGALQETLGYLQEILDLQIELAEKEVELAEERTEAAQSAYEAEIEARNNGYANAVDTARLELDQAKANQVEKEKMLAEAQKKQEAINTAMQVSSLITATAQILAAYASLPIVGQVLAVAAIAGMWATFIGAKAMAAQVTQQQYGEGGLEFLEGGSHASGHDIPLGATNSEGRQMRAEGGEALAIINKRNTAKYKKILPDVIDSFNKGTFEDKYLNAFATTSAVYTAIIEAGYNPTDTTKLENLLTAIKEQGSIMRYTLPNGAVVTQKGNVRRIIKRS